MNTLNEFIEKYRGSKLNKSEFVYIDSYGSMYDSPEEAFKSGREVKIKKQSELILDELSQVGIENAKDAKVLMDLLGFVVGDMKKTSTRTRVIYSPEEKDEIVEEWMEAEEQGKSKNEFVKEKNVAYTTLLKWIKERTGG